MRGVVKRARHLLTCRADWLTRAPLPLRHVQLLCHPADILIARNAAEEIRMALMTFDKSYSIGIPCVDKQHAGLFDALDELHKALLKGKTNAIVGSLVQDLLAYTRSLFAAEEAMLAKVRYPGLSEHQIQHRKLTTQVAEYAERYKHGEAPLSPRLINFLRDWLTGHIQREDRAYSAWLSQAGPLL
jgi:hemerythrin